MSKSDIVSEVFSTLRLSSDLYFLAELNGAVAVEVPKERRRIRFHVVRQGRCWLNLPGGSAEALTEGDIGIVPNGVAQVVSSEPKQVPVPLGKILEGGALEGGVLRYGTGAGRVRLLCGFCAFDEGIDHPVLANLPDLIVLRAAELGTEPWVAATLRLIALEADYDGQGTAGVLGRLMEVLLIQTVRRMSARDGEGATGFVRALSDPHLSKALSAIHKEPQVDWKIQGLAKLAGMSRARFAERFTGAVGMPPASYLTAWRLIKARAMLADSDLSMDEIAARCGYASVPSFSRRFKKVFDVGPGAYRRAAKSA